MKIIEIFESLQGEGPKIGAPSLFLRVCGCNMRCQFNCKTQDDKDSLKKEWEEAENSVYYGKKLKDLKLLDKGCDSYPAILPNIYNTLAKEYDNQQLADVILKTEAQVIIFTGGEPLLQTEDIIKIKNIVEKQKEEDLVYRINWDKTWWFETNGTVDIVPVLKEGFNLVISPKLDYMSLKQKEVFLNNLKLATDNRYKNSIYFKFVVQDEEQLRDLVDNEGWIKQVRTKTYIMPQGSQLDNDFLERSTKIADKCIELGLNFTPRLQNYLWKNDWGK